MARRRKGVVPAHLRPYLFKKGRGKKRTKKPSAARRARRTNPVVKRRPLFWMVTARRGTERLKFDGANFSKRRRAKKFGKAAEATQFARRLKYAYAYALQGWKVSAELLT